LSRWSFTDSEIIDVANAGVPAIIATIDTPQGELFVLGLHALPPVNREYATGRDRQLAAIPQLVDDSNRATLVLGDLNTTPWSVHFRRLLENSALEDCGMGFGLQPTWPTSNWLLRIPIDHCLRSVHLTITNKFTMQDVGSDHLPSVVDFKFVDPRQAMPE
jgi:endonuclease/exonuclease/phosphatase (EEP) superfamily protein YafD